MRTVTTAPPSFPEFPKNELLDVASGVRWQVLCGDRAHYRVGIYSPELGSPSEVAELEWHDCPEVFLLVRGRVTLVLSNGNGGVRQVPLEPCRPVVVTAPHTGFCPDGPMTGAALVIERDSFETEYRCVDDWRGGTLPVVEVPR